MEIARKYHSRGISVHKERLHVDNVKRTTNCKKKKTRGCVGVQFLSTKIWKEGAADIWTFPTLEIARYSSEPTYTASDSVSVPLCSLWHFSSANFFIVFVMTSFCRRKEQWCGCMFSSIFVHVMGFCSSPAWCSVVGFNSELYMSIALIHLLFWNLLASIELAQGAAAGLKRRL